MASTPAEPGASQTTQHAVSGEESAAAPAPAPAASTGLVTTAAVPEGEHALQTPWTFWYDKKLKKDEYAAIRAENPSFKWKDNLKQLGTFNTVESFWRHYVHLKRPSALGNDMNLYCFRAGEAPMWEKYPSGGVWILKLKKGAGIASKLWQDLLLGAVGEAFAEPTVVGVTLALRMNEDLLGVWNSDNTNPAVRFAIGEKLKSILALPSERTLIEYKFHAMSVADKSSYVNADAFVFTTGGSGRSTGGRGRNGGGRSGGGRSRRSGGGSGGGRKGGSGGRKGGQGGGRSAGAGGRRPAPASTAQ